PEQLTQPWRASEKLFAYQGTRSRSMLAPRPLPAPISTKRAASMLNADLPARDGVSEAVDIVEHDLRNPKSWLSVKAGQAQWIAGGTSRDLDVIQSGFIGLPTNTEDT